MNLIVAHEQMMNGFLAYLLLSVAISRVPYLYPCLLERPIPASFWEYIFVVLEGFDWHFQALVHFTGSAVSKSLQHQIIWECQELNQGPLGVKQVR